MAYIHPYYRLLLPTLQSQNITYVEKDDHFLVFGSEEETPIEVFTLGGDPDQTFRYYNPCTAVKQRKSKTKKEVSERAKQKRAAKAAKRKAEAMNNRQLIEFVTATLNSAGLRLIEDNDEENRVS